MNPTDLADIYSQLKAIKETQEKAQSTCPNCGYCPHCGRGGHYVQPYYPWYQPYPQHWWDTITSGSVSTSGGNVKITYSGETS